MSKQLYIGRDADGSRVTLRLELNADKLSICGSSRSSGGQMQDTIRQELDAGTFKPAIPAADLREILDIWDRWHLNDMKAGCEHQRAEGWDKRPIDPAKPLNTYGLHFEGQKSPSWNMLSWVRPSEHPEGLLTKPCPVCGYKYGTEWKKETLPDQVRARVAELFNSKPDNDEGPDIDKFIKKHSLRLECVRTLPNPDYGKGATSFDCRLYNDKGELRTPYHMGAAHLENWIKEHCRPSPHGIVSVTFHNEPPRDFSKEWRKLARKLDYAHCMHYAMEKFGHKFKPDIRDVLNCLARDCACVENSQSFDDFARDLGYDQDSIKAETIYRTIRDQARAIERMLGRSEYQKFCFELDTEGH